MSDDLILYSHPWSRGRIAHWMLEELGVPYRVEFIAFERLRDPAFRAINPIGKIPTVRHGETVVTECAAICAYLADAFPEAGLAPAPGDPARADYFRWLFFAAGPVEAAVTDRSLGLEVPADKRAMVGYGSYADMLDTLETAVAQKAYVAGDRFSAADVYVGSQIGWGLQFKSIEARPAFVEYWARLEQRPAHARVDAANEAWQAQQQQQQ